MKAMPGQAWTLGGGMYCPNGIRDIFRQPRALWTIPRSIVLQSPIFVLDDLMEGRMNANPDTIYDIYPVFQWHNKHSPEEKNGR